MARRVYGYLKEGKMQGGEGCSLNWSYLYMQYAIAYPRVKERGNFEWGCQWCNNNGIVKVYFSKLLLVSNFFRASF